MATVATDWSSFLSFLIGGGIGGVLVGWLKDRIQARENRRADHLKEQLRCIYGPASFLAEYSYSINERYGNLNAVYDREFCKPGGCYHGNTGDLGNDAAKQVIDVLNSYGTELRLNNEKLAKVIQDNYHLIDRTDMPFFQKLVMEQTRLVKENPQDGRRLPVLLMMKLDPPIIYSTDTTQYIRRRLESMNSELDGLRRPSRLLHAISGYIHRIYARLKEVFQRKQSG